MRIRRTLFALVTLAGGYVVIACGEDASSDVEQTTDAGHEASTVDTYVPDTSPPPDARSPELTGSACTAPTDCYRDLDGAALKGGEAVCIDKVTNGYCTHKCQTDDDCCAVPGECRTGLKQVCATFENTTDKYCFLSCEDSDIAAAADAGASDAGVLDGGFAGDDYCHANASTEFGCRSTGGGAANRKACLPTAVGDAGAGDGGKKDAGDASTDAADAADADGG